MMSYYHSPSLTCLISNVKVVCNNIDFSFIFYYQCDIQNYLEPNPTTMTLSAIFTNDYKYLNHNEYKYKEI